MKITWQFDPNDEDDKFELTVLRNAHDYNAAILEMAGLVRMLRNDPEVALVQAGLNVDDTEEEVFSKYDQLLEYFANQLSEILENVYLEE